MLFSAATPPSQRTWPSTFGATWVWTSSFYQRHYGLLRPSAKRLSKSIIGPKEPKQNKSGQTYTVLRERQHSLRRRSERTAFSLLFAVRFLSCALSSPLWLPSHSSRPSPLYRMPSKSAPLSGIGHPLAYLAASRFCFSSRVPTNTSLQLICRCGSTAERLRRGSG